MKTLHFVLLTAFTILIALFQPSFIQAQDQQPLLNPANCHYYQRISTYLDWFSAKADAESRQFAGVTGHLATITSSSEQQFIQSHLDVVDTPPGRGIWLGGFQPLGSPEPGGNWKWVTGEPFVYTNWAPGEPNNDPGNPQGHENSLELRHNGDALWNDHNDSSTAPYIVEYDTKCVLNIAVDIKPDSFPNSVNPKNKGVIPVAILTTASFDATTVNPTTVLFGPTGVEAASINFAPEDVDGDGDTDMILHFNTQGTDIQCGDTSASLTGKTFGGQAIQGADSIRTVGCK